MNPYVFLAGQLINVLKAVPKTISNREIQNNNRYLKEILCYNQAKIMGYSHEIDETHKALKEIHRKASLRPGGPSDQDLIDLGPLVEHLSVGMLESFREITSENFKYLHQFYAARDFGNSKPRFCVKTTYKDQGEFKILTAARDRGLSNEPLYSATDNTAFTQIINNNGYYLCNNIPLEMKLGNYKNSRINYTDVQAYYKPPSKYKNLRYRYSNQLKDSEWRRNWHAITSLTGPPERPPVELCYKSTLVIPISVVTRELPSDFSKNFNISGDRIAFGFLCLDHENIDFFKDKDVTIGYIFADLISLYLVDWLKCTVYSGVYREAMSWLNSTTP